MGQEIDGCGILILVQLVRILDAEFRLFVHQVERRIGDIDGAEIGLNPPFVGLAVRQGLFLEHHGPALRRLLEYIGIVGEHVWAPLIRGAIVDTINSVPGRLLQPVVDIFPVGNQVDINRLHFLAGHQAKRGIARSGNEIEAALIHKGDHFIRSRGSLDCDLAFSRLLEIGHPVIVLVAFTSLDIARPSHDIDLAFAGADFLLHVGNCGAGQCGDRHQGNESSLHRFHGHTSL